METVTKPIASNRLAVILFAALAAVTCLPGSGGSFWSLKFLAVVTIGVALAFWAAARLRVRSGYGTWIYAAAPIMVIAVAIVAKQVGQA